LPEQKYISDAGKMATELGALFLRHQAWVGLSGGVSELARSERRLDTMGLSKLASFVLRRSSGKRLLTLEGV
jgi:hypothetical protein